jgi:hypothetical protein
MRGLESRVKKIEKIVTFFEVVRIEVEEKVL